MYPNKIREYRKGKDMKLSQLAKKSNLSMGYLSHLERGSRKNPSYKVMKQISLALEKEISEIF